MKILASRTSIALLGLVSAHLGAIANAQTPPPKTAPKTTLSAAQTQQMATRVLRETSVLRGLSIKKPVKSTVKSRAQVESMLREKIKSELLSDEIAASEILMRQLGLVPAKFQLEKAYISLLGEQIAGYYDTKTGIFTTTERVGRGELETVMAHELTHALQDQHFNLARLEKWPEHDSDARLAFSALAEGDATLVMSRYTMQNPLRMLGVVVSSLQASGASQGFAAAPRVLRDSLTFPYFSGLNFTQQLFQRGGWASVSRAYTELPQSTEQILHFDKYEAREAPQKVGFLDLTPTLGAGWKFLDHDVNGEFGLFLTLAVPLGDDNLARAAAAGWGGDRFSVYRGAKNAVLVVQDNRFDTVQDAQEWRDAYAKSATKRLKVKVQKRGALQVWNAAPNGVWMEQNGPRVLILEGTVGAFNATKVMAKLRGGNRKNGA